MNIYSVEAYDKNGQYLQDFSKMISGMGYRQSLNHCKIAGIDSLILSSLDTPHNSVYKIAYHSRDGFRYRNVTPEEFCDHLKGLRI